MQVSKHMDQKSKQVNLCYNDRDPRVTPVMESVVQGGAFVGGS